MKWAIDGTDEKTGKPMHIELEAASADAARAQAQYNGIKVETVGQIVPQGPVLQYQTPEAPIPPTSSSSSTQVPDANAQAAKIGGAVYGLLQFVGVVTFAILILNSELIGAAVCGIFLVFMVLIRISLYLSAINSAIERRR